MRLRSLPVALVAVILAAGSSAPPASPPPEPADHDAPTPRWREGPARYLLTWEEDTAFRTLGTDAERADFIRRFWAARDPDPATPANERRTLFHRRVAEADRLFKESTRAGWKTDRGKIYILLGPPDDIDAKRGPRGEDQVLLWSYRDQPKGIGADAAIRFERDATGEYRLSTAVDVSSLETPLSIGFQTQALQMKSLSEQRGAGPALLPPAADSPPFQSHSDFFRSYGGDTFVILTLQVAADRGGAGGAPGKEIEAAARLVRRDPGGAAPEPAETLPETRLAQGTGARGPLFQGGVAVPPGSYDVRYEVRDPATGEARRFEAPLAVPDLSHPRFEVSAITFATALDRLPRRPPNGYSPPFVMGNLRAVPLLDGVFRGSDELAFYFQVYGAGSDPIDGRADLDIEYHFATARGAGPQEAPEFAALGEPIRLMSQRGHLHGYALPLRDFKPGTYRLTVRVTDNLDGRQAEAHAIFKVL